MLKGSKSLALFALCLLCLSTFAQEAAAAQWVETGRTATLKSGPGGGFDRYSCSNSNASILGYPGSCPNDAASGWTVNYSASSAYSNWQINNCDFNSQRPGSACYGIAYAINGQSYPGDLPTACSVGTRAVLTWNSKEVVTIEYDELSVDNAEVSTEFVCQ